MRTRLFSTTSPVHLGTVGLLLVGQLVVACGIPLPAPAASRGKDTSTPFPCMDRPCGCMTAEQCWKGCCCFTTEEKLAWAARHHVTPPLSAQDLPVNEANPQQDAVCSCCCQENVDEFLDAVPLNCQQKQLQKKSAGPLQDNGFRWVSGMMAASCQGLGNLSLLQQVPALPPSPPLQLFQFAEESDRIYLPDVRAPQVAHSPPLPPPRQSASH